MEKVRTDFILKDINTGKYLCSARVYLWLEDKIYEAREFESEEKAKSFLGSLDGYTIDGDDKYDIPNGIFEVIKTYKIIKNN